MYMKQCKNGHFYNSDKFISCPYCSTAGDIPYTRPLTFEGSSARTQAPDFPKTAAGVQDAFPHTLPVDEAVEAGQSAFPKTVPVKKSGAVSSGPFPSTTPLRQPSNGTVAMQVSPMGIDPVRGWLVCVAGEKEGQDYRIHSDKNFVGRAGSNDICLDFDSTISAENHAAITYDPRNNQYWIQPGQSKNNIYLNDNVLLQPTELKEYDLLTLGKSQFVFVPFRMEKLTSK